MRRARAEEPLNTTSVPQPQRLGTGVPSTVDEPRQKKLPRGATSLPKRVVEEEQRKRLVVAIARVISEKGYADVTVTDIISVAGISRATFYQLFKDKEECFLFGFKKLSKAHIRGVERDMSADRPAPERLLLALRGYLQRVDADLSLAKAFIAEAESATARSRAAYAEIQDQLLRAVKIWLAEVRRVHPEVSQPRDIDMSLMMAGLTGHVVNQIRRGVPFAEADVLAIFRFVLACLGLYEWARHTSRI